MNHQVDQFIDLPKPLNVLHAAKTPALLVPIVLILDGSVRIVLKVNGIAWSQAKGPMSGKGIEILEMDQGQPPMGIRNRVHQVVLAG